MALDPRQWKFVLGILGMLIVISSVLSARYLVTSLADEEHDKVEQWLVALKTIEGMSNEEAAVCDITLHTSILESNTTIPMIIVGPRGEIISGRNFGTRRDEDSVYLARVVQQLQEEGVQPIITQDAKLYFSESTLLKRLRYFPYIQLALLAAFIGLAYFAFSAVRRSEQNRVWVGMAKETAHQLGTPISAIMAWVDHLKEGYEGDEEIDMIAGEMARDVDRLQLVADRFNKIGSTPELDPEPIADVVEGVYSYMSKRSPRKMSFKLDLGDRAHTAYIAINRHLFQWVLENLVRNALDAMDGRGELVMSAYVVGNTACIEIKDTGKGIPASKHKAVFRPGYTTKSRGWGLGLSLAKRIVEEYHGGKIFVKESAVGHGSTFAVEVPLAS